MRAPFRRKRGFTLIETVVTVGIIAALAAVVYPQVVKQFNNADPARAAEDLNNLRTAIETFTVNIKSQPGDIEDLVNQIGDFGATDAQDRDSSQTGFYSSTDSSAWLGPYLGVAIDTSENGADSDVITTGYGATISNYLMPFDVNAANGGAELAKNAASAADFLSIQIDGLSIAAATDLNDLIDGTNEGATLDLKRVSGLFRCPGASFTSGSTPCYYLVSPIK